MYFFINTKQDVCWMLLVAKRSCIQNVYRNILYCLIYHCFYVCFIEIFQSIMGKNIIEVSQKAVQL